MEEKDWIILQTIFEERNITKASERLYISQPALTYRLQQLEKEFDTTIVLRGKKGVEFTSQGEQIVHYAKDMLLQLRKTKELVKNMDNQVSGKLHLGVSSIFARYELPTIIKGFLSKYPDVDINLKTGWSLEINHMLHREEVHLGIVRGNYNWQEEKYLFREESIYIASTKKITLEELPNIPRINYGTDQTLKTLIDNWWQVTYDKPPQITMEVDRIDTCKEMVLTGLGYAILPSICLKRLDNLHTIKVKSPDGTPLVRKTWLVYRDTSLKLSAVKAFVDYLKQFLR